MIRHRVVCVDAQYNVDGEASKQQIDRTKQKWHEENHRLNRGMPVQRGAEHGQNPPLHANENGIAKRSHV